MWHLPKKLTESFLLQRQKSIGNRRGDSLHFFAQFKPHLESSPQLKISHFKERGQWLNGECLERDVKIVQWFRTIPKETQLKEPELFTQEKTRLKGMWQPSSNIKRDVTCDQDSEGRTRTGNYRERDFGFMYRKIYWILDLSKNKTGHLRT